MIPPFVFTEVLVNVTRVGTTGSVNVFSRQDILVRAYPNRLCGEHAMMRLKCYMTAHSYC